MPTLTKFAMIRLRKELEKFATTSPDDQNGLALLSPEFRPTLGDEELTQWTVLMPGPDHSLYQDESFLLDIEFGNEYPWKPPKVRFRVDDEWKAPVHEHIYSNGMICMSLLAEASGRTGGGDWSPAMTAVALLLALQSMLSSATVKQQPVDNDIIVRSVVAYGSITWDYHDDKC